MPKQSSDQVPSVLLTYLVQLIILYYDFFHIIYVNHCFSLPKLLSDSPYLSKYFVFMISFSFFRKQTKNRKSKQKGKRQMRQKKNKAKNKRTKELTQIKE